MTNSLIKNTTIETVVGTEEVPAIPYEPAIPPRTVYETRNVCAFRYPAGYGTYSYTTDSNGELRVIFTPTVPPATLATVVSVWSCQDVLVPVTYPGTPEQPYVPGYSIAAETSVAGYNLGWNAGGRSITMFTADASVEFKARASMVGAIVGMNLYDGIDSRYNGNTIDYAFFLARGLARIIQNGVLGATVGTYTDATVFKITRSGTNITYAMNGATVGTATGAPTTSGWLEAALYSGSDEVFDPVITQISAPDTTTQTATLNASLPALTTFMTVGQFTLLDATLPAMTALMETGLQLPAFAVMDAQLPAIGVEATTLTGEVGQITASMPTFSMLAADHPYGELIASLPNMLIDLNALEGNLNASLGGAALIDTTMSAGNFIVVTMDSSGTISSAFVVNGVVSAEMLSQASMGSTFAVQQILTAVMDSLLISGDLMGVPTADSETWVINLDTNGSTTYTNYAFNSYALVNGSYYGAGPNGLVRLDGDTDNGDPIRAYMHLGKRDFGSRAKKTVYNAYVGTSASGNLYIKLLVEGQSYIYKVRDFDANLQQQRFTFGKGLRSNYVEVELFNEKGADFELDSVEFIVADMTRKI